MATPTGALSCAATKEGVEAAEEPYWTQDIPLLLQTLATSASGLSTVEARRRLDVYGPNAIAVASPSAVRQFLLRFRSPLVLILLFAAVISLVVREYVDALIIIAIIVISTAMGFRQEYRASLAIIRLRAGVAMRSHVLRDGAIVEIPSSEIVRGDIVKVAAGTLVPADGVLLDSKDLYALESVLTGETMPAQKNVGVSAIHAPISQRLNCLFMGSSIRSGTGTLLVARTGLQTEYGGIAERLHVGEEQTEFERGMVAFGVLLMRVVFMVVLAVLVIHILAGRPTVDSLMFALALAVGLSPEMLPAILTVTLARGAQSMARSGVIVRRLNAIENLGSMNVLCTDKTGTLTCGSMLLVKAADPLGNSSSDVLIKAVINADLQTGIANPLDAAILEAAKTSAALGSVHSEAKLDEVPYDFLRKRLSVVVRSDEAAMLITKGAFHETMAICSRYATGTGEAVDTLSADIGAELYERFRAWSEDGYRVLALAWRMLPLRSTYFKEDEADMVFGGFLLFSDPPREDASTALAALQTRGVSVKIVSGDNELVCAHIARAVGLDETQLLRGPQLAAMRDDELWHRAPKTSVFAEVDPHQKERIIRALQRTGNVVGYLGDGINDAPALHAADVGISVDGAVEVARESADIVMMTHDLSVLAIGIEEGRQTFGNTIKYVFITTSAHFGNMVSLAFASLLLPFLPLLALQILLNNLLSDLPAMGIAGDRVDAESKQVPQRWNMTMIRSFMVSFGLVSSVFDLLTFGALLWVFNASVEMFRTGWFIESVLTQVLILLIVRTRRPFLMSRPSAAVLWTSLGVCIVTLWLPYSGPIAEVFSFVPLPGALLSTLVFITLCYVVASELTKRIFFRRFG